MTSHIHQRTPARYLLSPGLNSPAGARSTVRRAASFPTLYFTRNLHTEVNLISKFEFIELMPSLLINDSVTLNYHCFHQFKMSLETIFNNAVILMSVDFCLNNLKNGSTVVR